MSNKELDRFLAELSLLTKKHGFEIGGCGCCGSPYIFDNKEDMVADNLECNNGIYKCDIDK